MPLHIIRQDITKIKADVIVNPTNEQLIPGGGTDAAIHAAAGPKLAAACAKLGGCEPGQAVVTPGFGLNCKYIIHTVGPVWRGGGAGEKAILESCYAKSLKLAWDRRCRTAAFPLISSGTYGYPKDQVLKTAMAAIGEFLDSHEMTVYIVVYDRESYRLSEQLTADITAYIDDNYVQEQAFFRPSMHKNRLTKRRESVSAAVSEDYRLEVSDFCDAAPAPMASAAPTLEEAVLQIDESFSEMLLRKIDEAGIKDSECYKKANIDRKLFSKIRSDKHYKPSKPTVLAFAVALELSLDETREMLMKAGFALSRSNKFDIIIEFFIGRGNYNVFEINEALFNFDQPLLGM